MPDRLSQIGNRTENPVGASLREAFMGSAPEVARRVGNLFRDFRPPERADYDPTPHEIRLLKLLTEYKSAATELKVSVNTIAFT